MKTPAIRNSLDDCRQAAVRSRHGQNRLLLAAFLICFYVAVAAVIVFDTPVEPSFIAAFLVAPIVASLICAVLPNRTWCCPACGSSGKEETDGVIAKCPACHAVLSSEAAGGATASALPCLRCQTLLPKAQMRKPWLLPMAILTAGHMKPGDEGEHLYCAACARSVNFFTTLLAIMVVVTIASAPILPHAAFLIGLLGWIIAAGLVWLLWRVKARRCKRRP